MQQRLIQFLEGSGPDDAGRPIDEIIDWPDSRLESCHDFIQWVFPNRSRSFVNPQAPVLDDETVQRLKDNPSALTNVRRMLMRMYRFYDLKVARFDDGSYQLELHESRPAPWWIERGNHNFLRLTRILLTLNELGLHEDRDALHDMLDVLSIKHRTVITDKTIDFWRDAARERE